MPMQATMTTTTSDFTGLLAHAIERAATTCQTTELSATTKATLTAGTAALYAALRQAGGKIPGFDSKVSLAQELGGAMQARATAAAPALAATSKRTLGTARPGTGRKPGGMGL